ncbi:hypothetical protein CAC42_4605 [Sphaceloma murrayae]|uniref:Dynactin subunit 6 n=1 Tax=Sphaceloma murrayae TaxID=2082308 RepID=A0A2K1QNQ4_9PEZI|nr:hypothetical protein CAC42_4605 [Sphaceloma murrayae]
MSSKPSRPSSVATAVPPTIKPPCKIDNKAIISDKAMLVGSYTISIGPNAVLHPFAKIDATQAPVTIGEYCIICERATVGGGSQGHAVVIGGHTVVETGAIVEASTIGKGSTVGAFARLGPASELGQFCKVTPLCHLEKGTIVPDFSVIMDQNSSRIDLTAVGREDIQSLKLKGQEMHVDTLRRLIPSNIAKWI